MALLSNLIPWQEFEEAFEQYYSRTGTPAKPIRLMVSLLILKQMFNLGDETVDQSWVHNPYFQCFSGETEFQWGFPCDPSDLVHFRKRIGEKGVEKIFEISVKLQGKQAHSKEIVVDSTAQEKNITYPTDVKLARKIIEKCKKIAEKQSVELRQSYSRTVKKLVIAQRFAHHPKNRKQAAAAKRKIKTIAGRLLRELSRKLTSNQLAIHRQELDKYERILLQKQSDKQKLYSLHEPEVACIAKGKIARKFEFGSKVSVAMTRDTNVIVGIVSFAGNPHDTKTLDSTLDQYKRLLGKSPERIICDRGYRGRTKIGETQIVIPRPASSKKSQYQKVKSRKQFRRRAAIEPVIGHLKSDFRMARNFLKGSLGDQINALLAGAAFNFKRLLRKIKEDILLLIFKIINQAFKNLINDSLLPKMSC